MEAGQTEAARTLGVIQSAAIIKAASVVLNLDRDPTAVLHNGDERRRRIRMLEDIVKAFLHDAVEMNFPFRRKQPVNVCQLTLDADRSRGDDLFDRRLHRFGQAEPVELVGPKVV